MEQPTERRPEEQFGSNARDYRDEPLFAEGQDLGWMVEAARLRGGEQVLDVGAGAGHTALAFAPYVSACVGVDVTPQMVELAKGLACERGIANARFMEADACSLPFAADSFDVVTCRFAAHHFADLRRFVGEVARVLRAGGRLLVVDHYAPEDPVLDSFVNILDKTRDPSHIREHTLTQWASALGNAGLLYREVRRFDLPLQFASWVQRARAPEKIRQDLGRMLREAPAQARETFRIELDDGGQPLMFCLKCALFEGACP